MSDLLGIGASGVRAYQSALTTVSDNIANAATPGYARRTSTMNEISAAGGSVFQRDVSNGGGVMISGVNRSADMFRAADVRSASADLSRTETGITWLDRIENALTGNQLSDRLTGFFNSAKTVAADPSATTPRVAMLESATSVANAFAGTGRALDSIAADLDATADNAVKSLDQLGAALAKVNDGLGRASPGTANAAQLADQRDQLLEQMSAISDVSATIDTTGRATVRLGGASGPVFVAGNQSGHVSYARNEEGTASFTLQSNGVTVAISPQGGVLAGIADGAQRIADAREQVDAIATQFVAGVNTVQAGGRDLDGNAGAALFSVGVQPTEISVSLTDPRGIAAASVGGGTRDNSNLAALEAVRNSGGFEGKTTALVASNAATLAGRRTVAEAQSSIRDGAVAARDAVSGVNIDSEAVDLLRFQQAYQASARVIQVARETLQSILSIQ
ncbi:flagellar hook-associated protein FlgK [Sphingomonas sp. So64.6b]|uniref:flagellar hook-associated protein FlgK n=1 Tax=Sphingomonas sp. So64.6b TaxID=2997354 RepID=UPI0015FF365C|nr:flagellar hook-associated protein FlgK [Sphingomonas sp. So64.6b]QNA85723.1 flagellar hook-associated protein FlgK [Sphingomonas sp. So64.6b]